MKPSAPAVVAFWGLLNAALAATLAGFGESPPVIVLYASVSALVLIIALVVLIASRRTGGARTWQQAPHADSALIFAAGVLIAGLAFAFSWLLLPVAALPLVLAGMREMTSHRRRKT